MMREARIKEARIEMEEELEGKKAREKVCRSATEVGRGGMTRQRECAIEWVNDL